MAQLSKKVAVVTGGSRGIGLAIAEKLITEGCHTVVSGRSTDSVRHANDHLVHQASESRFGRFHVEKADVRVEGDVRRLLAIAEDSFGGLDILINNAGVGLFGEVADQEVVDWNQVIDTNLTGVFLTCREAVPLMRKRGAGWIVNVSSLAGSHPFAKGAAYCASKAGLDAFTISLMQELRFDGIRVTVVAPGSVGTDFAGGGRHAAEPWKLEASDVAQTVVDILHHDARSLPSRVEIRPSQPGKS